MNWPKPAAYLVFFLVPILLWLVAALATKRKLLTGPFAFIAGSDNRLSLSRLQALAWTLVIFGSFAAAMAIHTTIASGSAEEMKKAEDEAKAAINKADDLKGKAEKAASAAEDAAQAQARADENVVVAETSVKALAADASEANKKDVLDKARNAKDEAKTKANDRAKADKTAADLRIAASKARDEANIAIAKARRFDWVAIPTELLMLAGIAIGSGVFSSLISAVNSEDKTASLASVVSVADLPLKELNQVKLPESALVITGKDLGKTGKIRLGWGRMGKELAPEITRKDDGTLIVVDMPQKQPDQPSFNTLVVDTPNGKLCHALHWDDANQTPKLGDQKQYFEFGDLFRDDKNPANFDLMKFQMFGWTAVAILIYSYLFIADLRDDLTTLPIAPQSIVLLTGLSQAGYLTSKGISKIKT